MTVNYHTEQGILVVTLVGDLSQQDALRVQQEASKRQKEHGIRGILVDARLARSRMSTIDRFELLSSFQERFSSTTKHAVVYSPGNHDLSEVTFAENVAFNRGVRLKMFTDIDEARDWLSEKNESA